MGFRSDIETLVLGVLSQEPLHGYDIAKRISKLSSDALRVGDSRLYPALHKLENEGLIVGEWSGPEAKPRKVYSLTEAGIKHLEVHQTEWQKFAHGVSAVLGLKMAAGENNG